MQSVNDPDHINSIIGYCINYSQENIHNVVLRVRCHFCDDCRLQSSLHLEQNARTNWNIHCRRVVPLPDINLHSTTRTRTPGGTPASMTISASFRQVSEAVSLGLRIVEQPEARAGATFQEAICKAKNPPSSISTVQGTVIKANVQKCLIIAGIPRTFALSKHRKTDSNHMSRGTARVSGLFFAARTAMTTHARSPRLPLGQIMMITSSGTSRRINCLVSSSRVRSA